MRRLLLLAAAAVMLLALGGSGVSSSAARLLGFTDGAQPLGSKATTSGDVLTWNGSAWARATIAGAGGITDPSGSNGDVLTRVSGSWSSDPPGAVSGVQAYDADLSAYAAVTPTAAGLALLDDADAAAQRTTLGISGPVQGLLTAAGISAGSTYEVIRALDGAQYLQLKRYTTYTTARSSALTGTEWGRTWVNGANLDGADQDTTTSDGFYWDHDATNTDWTSGGVTAPYYYHTVTVNTGDRLTYTVRISCNGDANYELFGIFAAEASAPQTNYVHLRAGFNVATGVHRDASSGPTLVSVSATGTQLTNGVWLRLIIDDGGIHTLYNLTNQATPPTGAWTRIGGTVRGAMTAATAADWWTNAIRVGLSMITVNASNNFTGSVLYEDMQFEPGEAGRTGIQWGAMLLDTTATEQLVGEIDYGSAVTLNQTALRLILADAVNARPGDSGTVTWSVVGGSSSGPASSTYYAANALVVSGSYRYWRVYAKITSATGAEQGSIRMPLTLAVSP